MGEHTVAGSVGAVLVLVGVAAIADLVAFAAAYAWARIDSRYRVLDVVWGLSFVGVAATSFGVARWRHEGDPLAQVVVLSLVGVWGVRLALHLHARQRGAPEDPRYTAMLAAATTKRRHPAWSIVAPQAALGLLVALPIAAAMGGGPPRTWVLAAGIAVFCVGLAFEAIGDAQLARFRADPASRGRVLDTGLWAWTRHPNYFGDATAWWGVWVIAASTGYAFATVLSPIAMTILLTSVSGRPMLESSLSRSKAGWNEYVARTSAFIPMPPRSGATPPHPRVVDDVRPSEH